MTNVHPDRLVYSCLMDNNPKIIHQTFVLIWTLLDLAHVPARQIVIHAIEGGDDATLSAFRKLGVRLRMVKPFREGFPHCNKMQQLASPELLEAEVAVLLDTDIAVVQDISSAASAHSIRAKVVDLPHPPLEMLQEVFREAGFDDELVRAETSLQGHPTLRLNCNGGVYFLPRDALVALSKEWPQRARWLIDRSEPPGRYRLRIDQVAFALACHGLGLDIDPLPLEMNYPTHKVGLTPDLSPLVLHYHNNVNPSGLLKPIDQPKVNVAIEQVNQVIRRRRRQSFDNKLFWNFRYATAPDRGSGIGSRGECLTYKHRLLLEQLEQTPETSVLDVGCGDLEATRVLDITAFTGVDISEEAIRIAREKRPDWSFVFGDARVAPLQPHDVVICLDVLIHQPTKTDYEGLLARIIALARKQLLVSGYNQTPWYTSSITFFYESLAKSLIRLAPGARLTIVGGYRDSTILRVDLPESAAVSQTIQNRPERRFETPYGVFYCYQNDFITTQLKAYGAHTRNELAMLLSFVREGDVIMDVGAHIGTFAVPLARAAGEEGRVIAAEPDAHSLALLRKNVMANRLDAQVIIVEALVSDEPKPFRQVIDPNNTGASYFIDDSAGTDVPVFSLDALWRQQAGEKPVDIVKIDTEGMELSVLRSGREVLRHCRPILYFEVVERHLHRYGCTPEDVEELLRSYGYTFFRNRGPRNSDNDFFEIVPLSSLRAGGTIYDCLALPKEKVEALMSSQPE